MFSRSGYRAIQLGDIDHFLQPSTWRNGKQSGSFSLGYSYDPLGHLQGGLGAPQGFFSQICHTVVIGLVYLLTILTFPISGWFVLKTVPTYERVIVFRLGRIRDPRGPGLVLLLPFIDHSQYVDLRTRAFNIPPCKLTSQDGALVSVGADVQFRVSDPVLSIMSVNDLNMATRTTAQNAMTKLLLKKNLREIQTEKLKISEQLLMEINDITKYWGLEVDRVELILEAVLQVSAEKVAVPASTGVMNPVPGAQGLDSTFQQLALHFLSNSLAAVSTTPQPPLKTVPEVIDVLPEEVPPIGDPGATPHPFRGERILVVGPDHKEIRAQVEHVRIRTPVPPSPMNRLKKHYDPEELLLIVNEHLSEDLVNHVGACYQFKVQKADGELYSYYIDLSEGEGETGCGLPRNRPDVVLGMTERDLARLVCGDLSPIQAHFSGKLTVDGDLNKALRLEQLFRDVKESIQK